MTCAVNSNSYFSVNLWVASRKMGIILIAPFAPNKWGLAWVPCSFWPMGVIMCEVLLQVVNVVSWKCCNGYWGAINTYSSRDNGVYAATKNPTNWRAHLVILSNQTCTLACQAGRHVQQYQSAGNSTRGSLKRRPHEFVASNEQWQIENSRIMAKRDGEWFNLKVFGRKVWR